MNKCQVITMIAVAGLTGSVLAQDKTTEKTTEKTTTRHEEIRHERSANDRMNAGEQYLVPSSRAIGVPVKGADGAHLGDVKEAVIRGSSGRVVYVLVTKGLKPVAGEPTASERVAAVPFGAFAWDDEKKALTLPMTEEQFKAAPSLELSQWQTIAQPAQGAATYKYFNVNEDRMMLDRKEYRYHRSGAGRDTDVRDNDRRDVEKRRDAEKKREAERRDAEKRNPDKNVKPREGAFDMGAMGEEGYLFTTSQLRGQPLLSREGRELGTTEDVVFDAPSGRIAFVVFRPATSLQAGEGRIAVPWPVFEVDPTGRVTASDIDAETLRSAPRLTKEDWEDIRTAGYTSDMYKRYGYDAGTWDRTDNNTTMKNDDNRWRDKYRTAIASGTPRTIRGKITSISEEDAKGGAGRVVVMDVKTDDGETVKVHTAPQAYLDEHKLGLHKGDNVTVIGKTAQIDGKQCFCATELSAADGKRVVLYSTDGDTR